MTLDQMWKLMLARGGLPNELLLNREGDTIPAADAVKRDMQWDVIYFRADGWTIAADFYLAPYVMPTHTDPDKPWVGKIERGQPAPFALTRT